MEWLIPLASPNVHATQAIRLMEGVHTAGRRAGTSEQFAATALRRPLFSQSRRPPAEKAIAAGGPAGLPRLSGIMIEGVKRRAIFEGDGKSFVTGVGDHVGDYKVLAITPADVMVTGPRGVQLVSLAFDKDRQPVLAAPVGGDLLARFRGQHPPRIAVPRPPSMVQMLAHLPRRNGE
jgi:hypothetical protein